MYNTKIKNKQIIGFMFLVFALFSCKENKERTSRVATLPFYKDASFTPYWLSPNSKEEKQFHKIPTFSMTNQEGKTITDKTLENKIYVADFFFTTCPGICPKMTNNMGMVQEAFTNDDDVMILSYSVTPEKDSVTVLKNYAVEKGVDAKKWNLLTGNRQEIYDLGRKSYFVEEDLGKTKNADDFLHTENFVLIDKNKHIRGIYNGLNKTSVAQLIADIKTLKKE